MKILSARQFNYRLKATVQKTGKLSFTPETAKALCLSSMKGIKFFTEGEQEQLCMAVMKEHDEDAFPLKKTGAYYYVAAQLLFDELGIDYKSYTVIYDLIRCPAYDEEAGGTSYKMNYRPIKKKSSDEDLGES